MLRFVILLIFEKFCAALPANLSVARLFVFAARADDRVVLRGDKGGLVSCLRRVFLIAFFGSRLRLLRFVLCVFFSSADRLRGSTEVLMGIAGALILVSDFVNVINYLTESVQYPRRYPCNNGTANHNEQSPPTVLETVIDQ